MSSQVHPAVRIRRGVLGPGLCALTLSLAALPARAEHDPWSGAPLPPERARREVPSPITDRFYVEGAWYMPQLTTRLRVDPSRAPAGTLGTRIDAEHDLALASRPAQGRMELMFRLRQRNRLRVDYEEVDRSSSHLLGRDINFGNQLFLAGERTNTELNWRIFTVTYTYSLLRRDRFELGTGLAAHFLEARAHGDVPTLAERQDVSGAGAFPTVPLDMSLRISRRFVLTARGQYFRAHLGKFDGSLTQLRGDLQYRWKPNFTIGAGWAATRVNLNLQTGSFPGAFSFNERGLQTFFRVSL